MRSSVEWRDAAKGHRRLPPLSLLLVALPLLPVPLDGRLTAEPDRRGALAREIDAMLDRAWAIERVAPSPPSTDAEFFRRVHLDLIGRIPDPGAVREFLADASPARRDRVIDELLASPESSRHLATVFTNWLIARDEINRVPGKAEFRNWLEERFEAHDSWKTITRAIVTAGGTLEESPPVSFYLANGPTPQGLAAETSRLFLGMRIDCAQCHDHPFADMEQETFWSFAAFYSRVRREKRGTSFALTEKPRRRRGGGKDTGAPVVPRIRIPDSKTVVSGSFLDGEEPGPVPPDAYRETLASWITSPENPYFARATVNRLWAYLFNRGLVEPVDDFIDDPEGSHPELLDRLATAFVESDFDLRLVLGALARSRAYQMTTRSDLVSAAGIENERPETAVRNFATRQVRALSPEQIFDSLARATGADMASGPQQDGGGREARNARARQKKIARARERAIAMLATAENPADPQTYEGSIPVSLFLMNGPLLNRDSPRLERMVGARLPARATVEALFFATLSRPPDEVEVSRLTRALDGAGSREDTVRNLFWSLLNSSEFVLNH